MQHEEFERRVRGVVQTFRGSHPEEDMTVALRDSAGDLVQVTGARVEYLDDQPVLIITTEDTPDDEEESDNGDTSTDAS